MRKFKYLIIGLILILPFKISAASLSLNISCPDTAYPGDIVDCTISADTSGDINGISANYSLSDDLVYNSFISSSNVNFNVNQTTAKGFALGNTSGFPSNFTLGTLRVSIPSSATANTIYTITINNIGGSDLEYNDISTINVSDTIKVKEKEVVKPEEIPKEEEKPIQPENNNQNANEQIITQKKSNNANLSEIKLNGEKITLLPYETEYQVNVEYAVENMTITYKLEDSKANAKLTGSNILNVGENHYKIIVVAEDGTEKVYSIKINRSEDDKELSSNNYLSYLEIEGYDIGFDKEKLKYNIKIKNEDNLNVIAKTEDENAKIYIEGNKGLKNGSIINIIVTAEDNTVREYNITIKKESSNVLVISLIGIVLVGLIAAVITTAKKNNY